MKAPDKEKLLSSTAVFGLIAILVALAVVQYRWSREISTSTGERMLANLHFSMMGMREDLGRELSGLSQTLDPGANRPDETTNGATYTQRITAWKRIASHPELEANVYLYRQPLGGPAQLLRLNVATSHFDLVEWPASLVRLRERLRTVSPDFGSARLPWAENRIPDFTQPPTLPFTPWQIEESIPALLHIQMRLGAGFPPAPILEWTIVELNAQVIRQQILPELAQRYFAGRDELTYDVAVLGPDEGNRVLYATNSQLAEEEATSDVSVNLFGPPLSKETMLKLRPGLGQPGHGGPALSAFNPGGRRPPRDGGPRDAGPQNSGWGGFHLQPFRYAAQDRDWELRVRHHKGSLEAALAAMRWRHLAISFGVLLVLALTMAMIVHASRRAQRLAALQMDFVAGVSHELRTPLAVISSAAENLADGIVADKNRLMRYGQVIGEQTRQLTRLVEQILQFAATRQHRQHYTFVRVPPCEVADAALARSAEIIRRAGIIVAWEPANNLPAVLVDLPAVTDCLQNLIANAIKYGGEARWLGVRLVTAEEKGRQEVQFRIEDRGIGISSADLRHIFDPFYRSPEVRSAQIHGTGLGLSLAKNIAEAMGGRLSVISAPRMGSTFILHLPVAEYSPMRVTEAVQRENESEHIGH